MAMPELDLARMVRECVGRDVPEVWVSLIGAIQPVVRLAVLRALVRFGVAGQALAEADFAALRACRAETPAAFHVYIRSIAATSVLDHLRSESSLKKGSGKSTINLDDLAAVLVSGDSPADAAERRILRARIARCLMDKDEANRRIFWLCHRQGSALPGVRLGPGGIDVGLSAAGIRTRVPASIRRLESQ